MLKFKYSYTRLDNLHKSIQEKLKYLTINQYSVFSLYLNHPHQYDIKVCLVKNEEDEIIGWSTLENKYSPHNYFPQHYQFGVYVHPNYRGKGIGKSLLKIHFQYNPSIKSIIVRPWDATSFDFFKNAGARKVYNQEKISSEYYTWHHDVVCINREDIIEEHIYEMA